LGLEHGRLVNKDNIRIFRRRFESPHRPRGSAFFLNRDKRSLQDRRCASRAFDG
jgi:hypothetical protein